MRNLPILIVLVLMWQLSAIELMYRMNQIMITLTKLVVQIIWMLYRLYRVLKGLEQKTIGNNYNYTFIYLKQNFMKNILINFGLVIFVDI